MSVRYSWQDLERAFSGEAAQGVEATVRREAPHFEAQSAFARGRVDEGRRVAEFLQRRLAAPLRVLDVGAGNGGVALGLANVDGLSVHAIDLVPNPVLRNMRRLMGLRCSQTVGSAHDLPYADEAFDVVLCLETLEHLAQPAAAGREMMRVLRPGGLCMIMTPARLKYLLRPDPHYGIRGLLLLPDRLQQFLVTSVFRMTDHYDVHHTFWTLRGIARLFPGYAKIEPLFARPPMQGRLASRLSNHCWDRIVITKATSRASGCTGAAAGEWSALEAGAGAR